MRRGAVLLTLWLVVAGTAVAVGTWALSLVGGEISDRTVGSLSSAAIHEELREALRTDGGAAAGVPQTTEPGTTVTRTGGLISYNLSTPGGGIVANCRSGNLAYLVSWIPAQGYRIDDDLVRGPAVAAELKFEPDGPAKVVEMTATVRCVRNVPTVEVSTDDGHHGGLPTGSGDGDGTPLPQVTDDHGSGGHGADDGAVDDHHRGGGSSGGSSGGSGGSSGGSGGGSGTDTG